MRLAPPLVLALLATLAPTASLPVAAECTGQTNRFPSFVEVAPTAELVVIGTVVEPLRGRDGTRAMVPFRLRVDEVLRGEAPGTIDILGLRSGLPLRGAPACRANAFVYARVGDVIAIALDGTLGDVSGVSTFAFVRGRASDLVRAGRVTREDARAAVGPDATPSPLPGVLTGRAASDAFWQHLRMGDERAGVDDVVAAANLIVLGTPVGVRPWDADPMVVSGTGDEILLRIAVDEVVKGTPISSEPGFVDLLVGQLTDVTPEDVNALLPTGERSLFILYNLGERNRLYGQPEAEVAATRAVYTRILDHASVIRDVGGLAYPIVPATLADFPAEYEGGPFSTLLYAVHQWIKRDARREARAPSSPAPTPVASAAPAGSPAP